MRNAQFRADDPYYGHLRMPLLRLVEGEPKRVLEIGCGQGKALSFLKLNKGAEFVAGIELVPEVAHLAREKRELDLVITGDVEQFEFESPLVDFDLIIASHVLEHVKDPWSLARRLNALLRPGGQLIGSLPNVRNVRISLPLLLIGELTYTNEGIMDWTHTKFFTNRTIRHLLESSGFTSEKIQPEFSKRASIVNWLTLGVFRNLLCFTYNFSAKPIGVKVPIAPAELTCASS